VNVLGLDIGGANLKAVHSQGNACCQSFAVWKNPQELSSRLKSLFDHVPAFDGLALTMTAELCDCFANKRDGVRHVLDAVTEVQDPATVRVWSTESRWMDIHEAAADPLACAAANWHAQATWLARTHCENRSLMIDVGSTTSDIICLHDGKVEARGLTDTQRLQTGELVYFGVWRTPLAAVSDFVWLGDKEFATMAEHFATTADVFVLTGDTPAQPDCTDTADDRPLTEHHAAARVLRMIGADLDTLTLDDARQLARAFSRLGLARLRGALGRVAGQKTFNQVFVAGSGEFFAAQLAQSVKAPMTRLSQLIDPNASKCACAYALVQLWEAS